MGFLKATVNLDETKFKQENLVAAQKFLSEAIAFHDPEWLDKPQGLLGQYWKREDIRSICFLINFADTCGQLQYNLTEKSVNIFVHKFKELLRSQNERQFKATLLELQFARVLSELVSPISFEPLVPAILEDRGKKPVSPDYAIKLPDGNVLIEITTFYFGTLEKWIHATSLLGEQMRELLEKRNCSRAINITFPLEFDTISLLPRNHLAKLADEIFRVERGKKNIVIRQKEGVFEWQPIRQMNEGETEPMTISFAFRFQKQILNDNYDELFLNSLRNTLNKKQKQGSKLNPYLIGLELGHDSIRTDGVMAALRNRIWPNPKYSWLTGILIFTPAPGFSKSDPPPTMNYSFNPNAEVAPIKSLIELLENNERFHLRDGIFHSK